MPQELAAIDGQWSRVAGATSVDASLSTKEILARVNTREPGDQSFTIKDGKGTAVNHFQDLQGCSGDREITFTVDEGGAWFVDEGPPRVTTELTGPEKTACEVKLGYAIFGHDPVSLERVQLVEQDRLLVTYRGPSDQDRSKVRAQIFGRVSETKDP